MGATKHTMAELGAVASEFVNDVVKVGFENVRIEAEDRGIVEIVVAKGIDAVAALIGATIVGRGALPESRAGAGQGCSRRSRTCGLGWTIDVGEIGIQGDSERARIK